MELHCGTFTPINEANVNGKCSEHSGFPFTHSLFGDGRDNVEKNHSGSSNFAHTSQTKLIANCSQSIVHLQSVFYAFKSGSTQYTYETINLSL